MNQPPPPLSFRPLTESDFPMLFDWLLLPHVAEWWDEPSTLHGIREEYLPTLTDASGTKAFVAQLDHEPIGFIQVYRVMGSSPGWWEDECDPGAHGIDQFLAHAHQLGQGLGTAMVKAFVERLWQDPQVSTIQTDPSPSNARAIRCYQKAGFGVVQEVITPDGPALLMRMDRQTVRL